MSIHSSVPSLPNQNKKHGEQWRFFMVSRLEKRNATIPEHCPPTQPPFAFGSGGWWVLGGVTLCSVAAILFLVGLVAIINPAGTKMADDGNPFGEPPSRWSSALICLAGVGVLMGGRWLIRTGNGTRSAAEPANAAYRR